MSDIWHIAGRGAIGLLWAEQLDRQQQQVELIVREHSRNNRRQLIEYAQMNDTNRAFEVMVNNANDTTPLSKLVVPLKAYDVLPVLQQLQPKITKKTLVILCHNGMGTIEQVQQLLGPQQPLIFATTTHGAMRKGPYQVTHTGLGETKMGWCGSAAESYPKPLDAILGPVSWHRDIERILWQKLAVNGVINPLSAIYQCRNGQLLEPQYREKIQAIGQEISAVAQACQVDLSTEEVIRNGRKVMQATAQNYSSMNRDVAANRQTEIDFITGYIIKKARLLGIKTPANQALFDQIKSL